MEDEEYYIIQYFSTLFGRDTWLIFGEKCIDIFETKEAADQERVTNPFFKGRESCTVKVTTVYEVL